jgi:hypothetical protein
MPHAHLPFCATHPRRFISPEKNAATFCDFWHDRDSVKLEGRLGVLFRSKGIHTARSQWQSLRYVSGQ